MGAVMTYNWSEHPIVLIDELGDEFLESVKQGDRVKVDTDGTVTII